MRAPTAIACGKAYVALVTPFRFREPKQEKRQKSCAAPHIRELQIARHTTVRVFPI